MRAKAFWLSLSVILAPITSQADTPSPGASYTFTTGQAALEWHPFRLWHGMMVTDLLLDGKSVPAVIDTGATVSASLDEGPLGTGKALPIEAIGGHVEGKFEHYEHVQIGGAQATHGPIVHIATGLMKERRAAEMIRT